jgi:hypothetical protein
MYPNLNIIPLGSGENGKEPSCGGGIHKEENFEKYSQLTRTKKAPMYAILTGKANNLIVIDYDIYKEGKGTGFRPEDNINLKTLKTRHGAGAYIVATQRGGFHVYHKYSDQVDLWTNQVGLKDYIDIRTNRGYIVGGKSTGYKELSGTLEKLTEMPPEIFEELNPLMIEKQKKNKPTRTTRIKTVKEQDEEMVKILKKEGFKDVVLGSSYDGKQNFDCLREECPLCKGQHTSNSYYFTIENTGGFLISNYSESCWPKRIRTYEMVKELFERHVCRLDDKLNYAVRDGDDLNLYQKSGILERFSHLQYEEEVTDKKGKTETVVKKFVWKWVDDPDKHAYRKMDFYPENCPDDVYNTWRPFSASTITETGGSAEMFFELLNELTRGDPKDYAKKYLAFLVQKPNEKPTTCLVLRSNEGVGKGRCFYALKKVMGRHLVTETNNPEMDVFGTNADAYNQTKLVIMNESNATTNFKNGDRLKSLVSDEDGLMVNQKYIKPYEIRNLAGSIIAGNGKTLVNKSVSDRRFVIYECGEKFIRDEEYFGRYTNYINQPKNQRAVYNALMAIDLEGFNLVKDMPKDTEANLEAREKCLPKFLKFLEWDFMEHQAYSVGYKQVPTNEPGSDAYTCYEDFKGMFEEVKITATDYCELFKEWSGDDVKGFNRVKFGIAMRSIMKDHKIPEEMLKKKDTKGGVVYTRNRGEGIRWLKKHNFTSREPVGFEENTVFV